MAEFGHIGIIGGGVCLDGWGVGPFVINAGGKTSYRFNDSDRFGPLLPTNQPGERSPFWKAHRLWKRQGRRLADDGVTCIYDPPRPTLYKKVGRMNLIVEHGDEDGDNIEVGSPSDTDRKTDASNL